MYLSKLYDQKDNPNRYEAKDLDDEALEDVEIDHYKILKFYMEVLIKGRELKEYLAKFNEEEPNMTEIDNQSEIPII